MVRRGGEKMGFEDKKEIQEVRLKGTKPYHKPELQVYGDLKTITGAVNNGHPNADGGTLLTKT
jgi:hypothetical protein